MGVRRRRLAAGGPRRTEPGSLVGLYLLLLNQCRELSSSAFPEPAAQLRLVLGTHVPVSLTLLCPACWSYLLVLLGPVPLSAVAPGFLSPALSSWPPLSPAPGLALARLVPVPGAGPSLSPSCRALASPQAPAAPTCPGTAHPPSPPFSGHSLLVSTHFESCFGSSRITAGPAPPGRGQSQPPGPQDPMFPPIRVDEGHAHRAVPRATEALP